jgi:hypothetical protein
MASGTSHVIELSRAAHPDQRALKVKRRAIVPPGILGALRLGAILVA